MKIIFDDEEQKEAFIQMLADMADCPSNEIFGLVDICGIDEEMDCDNCYECWENCGIEFEVTENSSSDCETCSEVTENSSSDCETCSEMKGDQ